MSKISTNHFEHFDDEILLEMAMYYPTQLKKMCVLISLDQQLEKESYEKNEDSSNRRVVC
jgi:hypothetical protein